MFEVQMPKENLQLPHYDLAEIEFYVVGIRFAHVFVFNNHLVMVSSYCSPVDL